MEWQRSHFSVWLEKSPCGPTAWAETGDRRMKIRTKTARKDGKRISENKESERILVFTQYSMLKSPFSVNNAALS